MAVSLTGCNCVRTTSDCLLSLAACDKAICPCFAANLCQSTSFDCYTRANVVNNENYQDAFAFQVDRPKCARIGHGAYIHKDIEIDIDKVIDHLALKNRRLQLRQATNSQ